MEKVYIFRGYGNGTSHPIKHSKCDICSAEYPISPPYAPGWKRFITRSNMLIDVCKKCQAQLLRAFTTLFDAVEPNTPEEIDAVLLEAGYNPDDIATRMQAFADKALSKIEDMEQ